MSHLTHLNQQGEAHMVDVSDKTITARTATARATVTMQSETLQLIVKGGHKKGDVFATARIAGIQDAKKCADLIPLCHPLALSNISVELTPDTGSNAVIIEASCKMDGKTGVEMEALTAVSVAALTLYDMCKAVDKHMVIGDIQVIEKCGGKSDFTIDNV